MTIGSTGVDEECSLQLKYKDGQSAQLFSAIRLAVAHEAKIVGETGRIELPDYWRGKKVLLHYSDGVKEFDLPYEASGYQYEAIEVMRCLDGGLKESPLMPLDESLALIRTMDLIRKDNNLRFPCE